MNITAVKSYIVHPGWRKNLILVKVETDEGLHGWGEAYSQYDRDRPVVGQLDALGPYLVGRSPFDIKHFTQFAFDDYVARPDQISPNQLKPKNGYIELPTAPGLNEEALRKDPGKNLSVPKLRTPADEGP
jgi:hypothetical protein